MLTPQHEGFTKHKGVCCFHVRTPWYVYDASAKSLHGNYDVKTFKCIHWMAKQTKGAG